MRRIIAFVCLTMAHSGAVKAFSQPRTRPSTCFLSRTSPLASSSSSETDQTLQGVEHLDTIRQELADHLEGWDSCVAIVATATGMDSQEAELRLAEATRWKAWATVTSDIARKYTQTTIPKPDEINETINWLQAEPLALTQEQMVAAIRRYPETYLKSPADNYKKALNVAPRQWRQSPEEFAKLVREQPRVMSLTYNCEDDGCQSECGSCWVTFRNSG